MSLAPWPFWLDGGYDLESVEACPYHPFHRWWTFRLGDVLQPEAIGGDEDELMVICWGCYVPRCGHAEGDPDPCIWHRHHDGNHVTTSQYEALGAAPDAPPTAA